MMKTTTADAHRPDIHIRPTTGIDDMEDVIHIHGRAWRAAMRRVLPLETLEQTTIDADEDLCRAWLANINDKTDRFFVAVDRDDTPLGYIHLRVGDGNEATIESHMVDPDRWREGIGTALLEHGLDELPEHIETVTLEMVTGNGVARQFYEHHGFELIGYERMTIDDEVYPVSVYRCS